MSNDDLSQAREEWRRTRQQLRKVAAARTAEMDQVMEMLREQIRYELSHNPAEKEMTSEFLDYLRQVIQSRDDDDESFDQFAFSIAFAVTGQLIAETALAMVNEPEGDQ